ncbi:DUF1345 domain-containing protein [Chroococcidiopsis sp. TS-821]|uniref:DUF1345 domain-containing protein n=1 Tax=Chroococcidiopsis sp. TS-821 TaxID=1378066 RepID=UPI000CEDE73A|nr:DUF1345 domain-containing protein [Chroococcidiopsis sp. TS-821]PPS43457.1 hypothetical protein B1A85_12285 [Chroococcidiopsis sp. TS-821]
MLRIFKARTRIVVSIGVAGLAYLLLPSWLRPAARVIIAWNLGTISFLSLAWLLIVNATSQKMHFHTQHQDEGNWTILSLIVSTACASLLAIFFMLKDDQGLPMVILILHVMLAGLTVICSWLLMHVIFALHYAHYYYRSNGGLDFPSENLPDYWDFLYFSFGIGMTCQVSDVQITSRIMRRLTLVHSIITFFFNTVILALSINIIAGLI